MQVDKNKCGIRHPCLPIMAATGRARHWRVGTRVGTESERGAVRAPGGLDGVESFVGRSSAGRPGPMAQAEPMLGSPGMDPSKTRMKRAGRKPALIQKFNEDQAAMMSLQQGDQLKVVAHEILNLVALVGTNRRTKDHWDSINSWIKQSSMSPGGFGFWLAAAEVVEFGDEESAAAVAAKFIKNMDIERHVKIFGSKTERSKLAESRRHYAGENLGVIWGVVKHITTHHAARRREIACISTQ